MSAKELSTACDASLATVYRRVDELETTGLLATETEYDPDGDHFEKYRAAVDRVGVAIEDGALSMELSSADDRADRFTRAWEGIRGGDG